LSLGLGLTISNYLCNGYILWVVGIGRYYGKLRSPRGRHMATWYIPHYLPMGMDIWLLTPDGFRRDPIAKSCRPSG